MLLFSELLFSLLEGWSMRAGVILVAALLLDPPVLEGDVESGPAKGEKTPRFKSHALTGDHKGKDVDFVAERKDDPTVFVFVLGDKWDRPMFRYLKTLDEAVQKDFPKAVVVAVWLTDKQDATREYLPKIERYFLGTVLTCYPGDKVGPKGWGLNADAHATTVVAAKGRVAGRFGYRSVNETDATAVLRDLKRVVGTE
jgi:hypothetical protein